MELTLKTIIEASPKELYTTWLNSEGHARMTGGGASITDQIGAQFTAWDGYIEGINLELEPNQRILQTWRTSDFDTSDEDSRLEILLKDLDGQTELTLNHSNLPEHGEQYKKGWDNHYFQPMKKYFSQTKE